MTNDHALVSNIFLRLLASRVACTLLLANGDFTIEVHGTAAEVTAGQAIVEGVLTAAAADDLLARGMEPGDELDALAMEIASGLSETNLIED